MMVYGGSTHIPSEIQSSGHCVGASSPVRIAFVDCPAYQEVRAELRNSRFIEGTGIGQHACALPCDRAGSLDTTNDERRDEGPHLVDPPGLKKRTENLSPTFNNQAGKFPFPQLGQQTPDVDPPVVHSRQNKRFYILLA